MVFRVSSIAARSDAPIAVPPGSRVVMPLSVAARRVTKKEKIKKEYFFFGEKEDEKSFLKENIFFNFSCSFYSKSSSKL